MAFNPVSSFLGLFSHDVGIDLGTANTLVMVKGRGIVIDEPSVVAIDRTTKKVLAIGAEAKRMVGRTPANIVAVRPLKDGVISDFHVTERMLHYFIRAVHERYGFGIPRLLFLEAQRLRWAHSAAAGVGSALYREMVESDVSFTNSAGIHAIPIAEYVVAGVLHFLRGLDIALDQQRRIE